MTDTPIIFEELEQYPGENVKPKPEPTNAERAACPKCDAEDHIGYLIQSDEYKCNACGHLGTLNEFRARFYELHPVEQAPRRVIEDIEFEVPKQDLREKTIGDLEGRL